MIDNLAQTIKDKLTKNNISIKYDEDTKTKPGWKFNEYEFKGVPVRLTLGARDLKENKIEIFRRDTCEKILHQKEDICEYIAQLLEDMQENLFKKALLYREQKTREVNDWEEFKKEIEKGGFLLCHWDGTTETELKIKEETKATIRCIPLENTLQEGKCVYSGRPSKQRVVFARSY